MKVVSFWAHYSIKKSSITVVAQKLVKLCDIVLVEISFLFINFMLNVCITQPTMSGVIMSCRFRVTCNKIISHKMFDHVVLVIIFLNCITIAMERPRIDPSSAVSNVTSYTFTHTSMPFKTTFAVGIIGQTIETLIWHCCILIFNTKKFTFAKKYLTVLQDKDFNVFKFW